MVEIPEHLLKRSKERRAAMGLGDEEAGDDAGSSDASASPAAPAKAESAPAPVMAAPSPESAVEPAAKPDPPFVAAAKSRRKIPIWVSPILAFLPFWALLYAGILEVDEASEAGAAGAGVFSANCASCHGADGGGGIGPQLAGGEVLKTFPSFDEQIEFVRNGSESGVPYGAADREGGQRVGTGGMPSFASLSDEELTAVVCHERTSLSNEDPEPEQCAAGAGGGGDGHGGGGGEAEAGSEGGTADDSGAAGGGADDHGG